MGLGERRAMLTAEGRCSMSAWSTVRVKVRVRVGVGVRDRVRVTRSP